MLNFLKKLFAHRPEFPICSKVVQYQQDPYPHECTGIFRFSAKECERILANRLARNTGLLQPQDEALLKWLSLRDESINSVVPVPDVFNDRFQHIAADLISDGLSDVFCVACGRSYSSPDFEINEPGRLGGWLTDKFLCPQKHPLLCIDMVHFVFSSQSSTDNTI